MDMLYRPHCRTMWECPGMSGPEKRGCHSCARRSHGRLSASDCSCQCSTPLPVTRVLNEKPGAN
eukprot:3460759-Amphidinium_carterae.1